MAAILDFSVSVRLAPFAVGVLLVYVWTVRRYRFERYDEMYKRFGAKYENGTLTPEEAQQVIHVMALYDMPTITKYAMGFVLYKEYAVVSESQTPY